VLATPGMDSHSSYVALSRHRDSVDLHYGRDDFADQGRLTRSLSRERAKDMASDYGREPEPQRAFAERRGITFRERMVDVIRKIVPERIRDLFDGKLPEQRPPEQPTSPGQDIRVARRLAVERHARAVDSIFESADQGRAADPDQLRELKAARGELDALRDNGSCDMEPPTSATHRFPARPQAARLVVRCKRCSSKPKSAPILHFAPIGLSSAGPR
jgi:hypothetical protein